MSDYVTEQPSLPIAPAVEATPTAITPAPATPQGTPAAAAPATPTAVPTQTPATGVPDAHVPSYRLREQRTQYEQRIAQIEQARDAEINRMKEQLRVLVGAAPAPNPEVEQVKQQFSQLYPGLSKIEERAAQIEALLERSGDLEAQTQHYWETYGRQTMDRLFTKAAETVGGPMTDEGKRALHSAFVGYVQSDPSLQDRYSKDPTIVDDFWRKVLVQSN